MASLKSHLVAFVLRHTRKKSFRTADAMHRRIAKARKLEDHRPPKSVADRLRIRERQVHGFPVYEVEPPGEHTATRLIYFHGGAYCFEITAHHWKLIAELCERLGMRVAVPIYPLAPEHDFHAMFGMALELYRDMLAETPAERIVFAGDSAGGNMALVLTMLSAEEGLPAPARQALISPGLDMTMSNPQMIEAAKSDPWLDIPGGLEAVRLYSAGIDAADWRISPLYGDLAVLPPTLLLTGTRDLLYPDTLVFADRLRDAGVETELLVEPGMIHVWPLIDMPEARRARDSIVAWLSAAAQPPEEADATAVTSSLVTD
ncbi:alpha/beta hydrolase [Nitratireductor mangrovi]|uniref:Alpha/beta hydrolase n=1 Tax=Nitratireductor mangrovi TaxID=2599600 RepID=A0A5B8L4L6_9HYPH|nr:alpha/beta hydrolase [Nitratireductor mangrovi]QDZ02936.1 alpha/beta hydrolase [Nitratireductor mangrovi]